MARFTVGANFNFDLKNSGKKFMGGASNSQLSAEERHSMNSKKNSQLSQKKANGYVLPFPPTPSASKAGYTIFESTHQRREEPQRLPDDAPNILIILLDDVGFGLSDTVGGEVHTPAFSRVAKAGLCYNAFHTTSICSPTRAALLTDAIITVSIPGQSPNARWTGTATPA
jgi:sulfatase-like protein